KMENIITYQVKTLFSGADERNWNKVKSVMDKQVLLDYSSMTGSPATNLTPEEIITAWAAFLPGFDRTNHKAFNFKVIINNDEAIVNYTGKADHFLNSEVWTVEGSYNTKFKRVNEYWLIVAHTFNFQKQSGNTNLPAEVAKKMERLSLEKTEK
ncbi:MAG TPA: nuclear transport factor 2 family protein, partial [Pedobacter sp.]